MKIDMEILKSRVKGTVNFSFFRAGQLWYVCEDGWEFPIPVEDTGNAQGSSPTFSAQMKGIYMMRWVKKAMEAELQRDSE
jgi:hypothetical protein